MKNKVIIGIGFLVLNGCANMVPTAMTKVIIDKSYSSGRPDWMENQKDSWEEKESVYFKTTYTIRGDQRVNACYDLARLSVHESVLAEVKSDIRAENNLASEGLSENEDQMITKSLTESLKGTISGLNVQSKVFERYVINHTERIDCSVLTSMKKTDYEKAKRNSAQAVLSVHAKVAEVVREKQQRFFASEPEE